MKPDTTKMKCLRVTMPDGSRWDVPCEVIARDRAHYYAKRGTSKTARMEYDEVFGQEFDHAMSDPYDIIDWAENNMHWRDVEADATRAEDAPPNYSRGWINGPKEIIEV